MTDRDELARDACWMCEGRKKGSTVEQGIELWIDPCPTCNGTGWTAREAREKKDGA